MWTWFLTPKNALLAGLAVLVLAAGLFIVIQKIEIAHKTATIITQQASIDSLTRANEIMNQNAIAAKEAQTQMQQVVVAAVGLKTILKGIPGEVRKGLKNETMERVNHCLGEFFTTGLLDKDCSADRAVLPKAVAASVAGGGGKSP